MDLSQYQSTQTSLTFSLRLSAKRSSLHLNAESQGEDTPIGLQCYAIQHKADTESGILWPIDCMVASSCSNSRFCQLQTPSEDI